MQDLHISLEDWQQAALTELAQSRGLDVERMAQSLLNERLIERMHTSFDDLLSDVELPTYPVYHGLDSDTIEQRLRRLFDE